MKHLIAYIRWRRIAFAKPTGLAATLQYVRAAEYDLYTGSRPA